MSKGEKWEGERETERKRERPPPPLPLPSVIDLVSTCSNIQAAVPPPPVENQAARFHFRWISGTGGNLKISGDLLPCPLNRPIFLTGFANNSPLPVLYRERETTWNTTSNYLTPDQVIHLIRFNRRSRCSRTTWSKYARSFSVNVPSFLPFLVQNGINIIRNGQSLILDRRRDTWLGKGRRS